VGSLELRLLYDQIITQLIVKIRVNQHTRLKGNDFSLHRRQPNPVELLVPSKHSPRIG